MTAKTIFIVAEIDGKAFDYPQNAPIPREGEVIIINGKGGRVVSVWHTLQDDLLNITIKTGSI